MSSINTIPSAQNRYVWVQKDECDSTRVICEPHIEIIEDLKQMVLGDRRAKYKTYHHQQYLDPGDPIPVDSTDLDPIHFKRIEKRRRKFFSYSKSAYQPFVSRYLFSHSNSRPQFLSD